MKHHTDGQNSPEDLKALILASLDADKALDIETIDLRGQTALADYMIIASGTSSRHIAALAEKINERMKARGFHHAHAEGLRNSDWVVLDAGDVIVHLFRPEVRSYYNLEKMWRVHHPSIELVHA